jgi:hypothetical protein
MHDNVSTNLRERSSSEALACGSVLFIGVVSTSVMSPP